MIQPLGHQAVELRFSEALAEGRLHHAWLLYGMKGIGKAVLAEKLAARLLCQQHTGCGECHACRMLLAGSHPDMHHVSLLEEKRDINIEQIRNVLEFLSLSGAESERRVVILDDAERLNGQAANALLKGLEEPSPGSLLLIVCADLMKLPATIRSRCLLQHCPPLSGPDVRHILQTLSVPERHLDLAVELADGCPGTVACLQDSELAAYLAVWRELTTDIAKADIGKIESWLQQHVKQMPHELILAVLLKSVSPQMQQPCQREAFADQEKLLAAVAACARWPGEVVRHSLRPVPSLLAYIIELRSALRAFA